MKILLINQVFFPDIVATAQHLTDLAEGLSAAGADVTVLAGRRGYAEPYPLYSKSENHKGIRILRVWPFAFGKGSRVLRITEALFINAAFAWKIFWMPRFDKVVCLTTPPLVAWLGAMISKSRGSEFIYWTMDINPDEAIEAGWIKKNSIQAKLLNSALRFSLKKSDKIIVLDRFMKERLVSKGADERKIVINTPWAHNEASIDMKHDRNPFRKKHQLNGKTIVMYSGNHSICHPLNTILEAAKKMRDENDIVFVFIGGGERVKDVAVFKEKHHLENILQLPYVPREELDSSLQAADIQIVVMGEPYVGIVHPCKIYGVLAAGRPFIYVGPRLSAIGDLIASEQVGEQVNAGAVDQFCDWVNHLKMLSDAEKNQISLRSRSVVSEKYATEVMCGKLVQSIMRDVKAGNHA